MKTREKFSFLPLINYYYWLTFYVTKHASNDIIKYNQYFALFIWIVFIIGLINIIYIINLFNKGCG